MSTPFTDTELIFINWLSSDYTKTISDKGEGMLLNEVINSNAENVMYNRLNSRCKENHDLRGQFIEFVKKINGGNYKIVKTEKNDKNGFKGIAIEGPNKDDLTIAFAGTDGLDDKDDILNDGILGIGGKCPQTKDAERMLKSLSCYKNVYLTGYSLGGHLAVSAALYSNQISNIKGITTFNPPGFGLRNGLKQPNLKDVSKITNNYINEADPVSLKGKQVGKNIIVKSNNYSTNPIDYHMLENLTVNQDGKFLPGNAMIHNLLDKPFDRIINLFTRNDITRMKILLVLNVLIKFQVLKKIAINDAVTFSTSLQIDTVLLDNNIMELSRVMSKISCAQGAINTAKRILNNNISIDEFDIIVNLNNLSLKYDYLSQIHKYLIETKNMFENVENEISNMIKE